MYQIHPQTNKVLLFIALIAIGFASYGQAPSLLNYQAIARNTNGYSLPNQVMNIRISIIDNSPSGNLLYSEIRAIKTNLVGLFSLIIGSTGAISYKGNIANINWASGDKYLHVEIDPTVENGLTVGNDPTAINDFLDMGIVKLVSVPYALLASSAFIAATVTTNANLSGAVTSFGNVTSIAPSPNLTGLPTAPTADLETSTTQIATTEFVHAAVTKHLVGFTGQIGAQGLTGLTGAIGATGMQGLAGATGLAGAIGVKGADGARGADGAKGIQGLTGAKGLTGSTGVKGADGARGIQGLTGAKGLTGATGVKGADGARGIQGLTGAKGLTGSTGVKGADGASGIQGLTGLKGIDGVNGIQGLTGATGLTGSNGVKGIDGVNGIQGLTGLTGASGVKGDDGPTGIQGLTGATGLTGSNGVQGIDGANGIQGLTGASGSSGVPGIDGATGIQGLTGATGLTGSNGVQGIDGVAGIQGLTGATGLTGSVGLQGIDGVTGIQGLTGLTGASGVKGDDGPTGIQGLTGATGLTGSNGVQGIDGVTGIQGLTGLTGASGVKGDDGPTGIQGLAGADFKFPITAGDTSQYWRWDKTWQTLNSTVVGLGNVNNTSDLDKPISTATLDYILKNTDRYNAISSGSEISTSSPSDVIVNGMTLTTPNPGTYLVNFNSQYTLEPSNRTAQAIAELTAAFNYLMAKPITNSTHALVYGEGEILAPGVYYNAGAVTASGSITLDAGGNPNAQFIFQFGAAFSTGTSFNVTLTNGASACNVFWVAEGAIAFGASTTMKGFIFSNNGAVTIGSMSNVQGNIFSSGGTIGLDASTITRLAGCSNNFGSINNFAVFSKSGNISNVGATNITGDISTNSGNITGFGSATINGSIYPSGMSNATASFSVYQNGIQIPFSSRRRSSSNKLGEISLQAIATVGSSENIDIRWNIDSGFIKLQNRILTLLSVR